MDKKISLKAQERQWQTEEDARTLARYQEIMASKQRREAAIRQAEKVARDLEAQAGKMKKAAKVKGR